MLPTTCYYDDFVVCCHSSLASNSEQCMSMLLDLLGWSFDKTGSKADSFSHSVSTLRGGDIPSTSTRWVAICQQY